MRPLIALRQKLDAPAGIAAAGQFQVKQASQFHTVCQRARRLIPPCHGSGLLPCLPELRMEVAREVRLTAMHHRSEHKLEQNHSTSNPLLKIKMELYS